MLIGSVLFQYVMVLNIWYIQCSLWMDAVNVLDAGVIKMDMMISSFVTEGKSTANSPTAIINDKTLTQRE